MRTLNRDKKPLYICKKVKDSDPAVFEPPVKRELNVVATTSQLDIAVFGESYKEYRRANIPISQVNEYHEGDRAYIYTQPPKTHDKLCETADFTIVSVLDSISDASVIFKRIEIGK